MFLRSIFRREDTDIFKPEGKKLIANGFNILVLKFSYVIQQNLG